MGQAFKIKPCAGSHSYLEHWQLSGPSPFIEAGIRSARPFPYSSFPAVS